RTCLTYDAQGNVASVQTGCATSGTPADCSSCSTPSAVYGYDDFGNVVDVTAPWTSDGASGPGTTFYEYDAFGNVLRKQTPSMVAGGELLVHAYDALGRETSLVHTYTTPSAGSETLYAFGYDSTDAPDGSCPQPSNSKGRLLWRRDSFGTTWYQYDVFGRVTGEVRVRTGATGCSASTPDINPHTFYTYSPNGNLTSVTYPYGRQVTYVYGTYSGTSVTTDRPERISVATWDGSAWTSQVLVKNIRWEPFGGLRSYQTMHPTSANSTGVEYIGAGAAYNPETPSAAGQCRSTYVGS